MTDSAGGLIIVRDGNGRFYVFTAEQWDGARLPDDVQAALAEVFDGDDAQAFMENNGLQFQHLLTQQQRESQILWNVLRSRHDTVKNSIGNIR